MIICVKDMVAASWRLSGVHDARSLSRFSEQVFGRRISAATLPPRFLIQSYRFSYLFAFRTQSLSFRDQWSPPSVFSPAFCFSALLLSLHPSLAMHEGIHMMA
jgi:hypothetical protein